MTTATEPPLIDEPTIGVDELPALDQPGERVCEIPICEPRSAAWAATFAGPCRCGAVGERELVLLCGECMRETRVAGCAHCGTCRVTSPLMHAEPL